jgi:multiple sugar transport system ATP-binding protein
MAAVDIRNVAKSFGTLSVMNDVNLSIEKGEFIVLVGPSGCGKSTLLRIIAGLEEASRGDIVIGGIRVNDLEPRERDIAMVFQSYALYPHMKVEQNLDFNMRLRNRPKPEIETSVKTAAGVLGLGALLERFPRQLSGGQRQRVAMGRAIVRRPQLFLFDEPLSNLDAKLRVQMRAEIRKLHLEIGATSIYVTHDQVEAMTMADRIVVMNKGNVEQLGSPLELYDKPRTLFVAEFIGSPSMNFYRGTVTPEGGMLTASGSRLPLPPGCPVRPGQDVVAGIRPEHLTITEDGPVSTQVVLVEHLGPETFAYMEGEQGLICLRLPRDASLARGRDVRLSVHAQDVHVFDPNTQQRLGG